MNLLFPIAILSNNLTEKELHPYFPCLSDTTININLSTIIVTPKEQVKSLSFEERKTYWREIRDFKIVYPYARKVTLTLIETYEYLQTLPLQEREAHFKKVKKEFKQDMEPKMKKLTVRQGQLLIKLINRETGSSSYEIVEAMVGGWSAWWWNAFAHIQGTDLKAEYSPKTNDKDALTERLLKLYKQNRL